MRKALTAACGIVAIGFLPASAQAQDSGSQVYVGVSGGYHDLSAGEHFDTEPPGVEINDSSPIVGGFVGVDFPLGGKLFAGVEGNLHMGTEAID